MHLVLNSPFTVSISALSNASPTVPIEGAMSSRSSVACHRHGTGVAGFLPRSWDHLDSQSWDHSACLVGGALDGSLDRRVRVVDAEAGGRGIQGGQRG